MILKHSYLEDVKEKVKETPDNVFLKVGINKEKLLSNNNEQLEKLWGLYQKSIEDYGMDPDFAYIDALYDGFGIVYDGILENKAS